MSSKIRTPFRGEKLEGGLGEWGGDPRRYETLPAARDMLDKEPFQGTARPPDPMSVPGRMVPREILSEKDLPAGVVIPEITRFARARLITDVNVTTPTRLDMQLDQRIEVLIWNFSTQIVWINFTEQVTRVGLGIPLAAVTVAGAYDGGHLSWDCKPTLQFWAIAAAGAANEVLIVEGAR